MFTCLIIGVREFRENEFTDVSELYNKNGNADVAWPYYQELISVKLIYLLQQLI